VSCSISGTGGDPLEITLATDRQLAAAATPTTPDALYESRLAAAGTSAVTVTGAGSRAFASGTDLVVEDQLSGPIGCVIDVADTAPVGTLSDQQLAVMKDVVAALAPHLWAQGHWQALAG